MEKTRQKPKHKKVKIRSAEESDEAPTCAQDEASSLSEELHQAMQDISIADVLEVSPTGNLNDEPEPKPEDLQEQIPAEEMTFQNPEASGTDQVTISEESKMDSPVIPAAPPAEKLVHHVPALYPALSEHLPLEISEPTAPLVSEEVEEPPWKCEEMLSAIRPFTEAQLANLYENQELELARAVSKDLNEIQRGVMSHRLYEMVSSYLRALCKLTAAQSEAEALAREARATHDQAWTIGEDVKTVLGKCQDATSVSASHKFATAELNEAGISSLGRGLSTLRELLDQRLSLHGYAAETLRMQIEHFIQEVLSSYASLPHNTPVSLRPDVDSKTAHAELCTCITVLFFFIRRPPRDEQFCADFRDWTLRLAGTLLRVATARDHLFLLFHVLRGPAGVTRWAAPLIQVPVEEGGGPLLDHALTFLSVLLSPLPERESFPEKRLLGEEAWVMLDAEGDEEDEGGGLLENDLVALLNQLPLDALFRRVLGVERGEHADHHHPETVNQASLLRLIAFASSFTGLLRTGLNTYSTPRYRQFAKRLSRLVRHTVQYVSEQWEVFREGTSRHVHDRAMLARIQVEYDALLLRATQCIFSSQRLGAWQFLAVVPYNVASSPMVWRLFCLLHHEYQEGLAAEQPLETDWRKESRLPETLSSLEFQLAAMPEAEAYFLLNTLAAMALSRGVRDHDLVLTTTLHLFHVGFVSANTREACSKTARSLLAGLASRHPSLHSVLLHALGQNLEQVGAMSVYLTKELPLSLWHPQDKDMNVLAEWMLLNPATIQSQVARTFLAGLDWAHLPPALQLQAALLVVEACLKYSPERSGTTSPGAVAEGVSSLAAMVRQVSSPEQGLSSWSWGLLSRLRLHLTDRVPPAQLPQHLVTVPDPEIDCNLEVLARGVREKEPIACFATLLATSWGHSIPQICSKGVPLVGVLLAHSKFDAACEALHHILPLFLDCPDALTSCDKFLNLLGSLVTSDRGYVKMAKSLLLADTPGPVLRQLANLIEHQFATYSRHGLEVALTSLWLGLLTSLPDWTREPSVSHLLDVTLRACYAHPGARQTAAEKLMEQFRAGAAKQGGALSSLFTWVSGGSIASLLPRVAMPEAPWLALYVLDLEEEDNERRTGLWPRVLQELADPASKASLDQAVKRAASSLKVPAVPVSSLSIYRWAQQALDSSLDHPLLPLFWQRFCSLYLSRTPPVNQDAPDLGGVGYKFFEGMVNTSYLKRLRKRLHDASELYSARAAEPVVSGEGAEEAGGDRRNLYARISRVLRTMGLWLEEPRLLEPSLYLPALPPQYDPQRLASVLAGDVRPWLDLVDVQEIQESQMNAVRDWQLQHSRHSEGGVPQAIVPSSPRVRDESGSPVERMLKRLRSYDQPLQAPTLRSTKPVVPALLCQELEDSDLTISRLKKPCSALAEFAQVHALRRSELAALDCGLLELLPTLYRPVKVQVPLSATCLPAARKKSTATDCAGPFKTVVQITEWRLHDGIQREVGQNRSEHAALVTRCLQPPPLRMCGAAVLLEHTIARLVQESVRVAQREAAGASRRLRDTGSAVFYSLVALYTEEVALYPPTMQLLTSCIEALGQTFISKDATQCDKLLGAILSRPSLLGLLSPHFSPHLAATPDFLAMYRRVSCGLAEAGPDARFALLTKFDIPQWLIRARPRLRERSHFIEALGEALTKCGREPPSNQLVLHEKLLRHLRCITMHDFPEHYGEVLQLLLQRSENQSLSVECWWCLLDSITPPEQPLLRTPTPAALRLFATQQRLLGPQEIRETAGLLATYFSKERLQHGLHGLYPKYRHYVSPLAVFLGMVGHSLVVGTLTMGRGALGDALSEQLWPVLNELFAPWLTPCSGQHSAAWIQQLCTDDRTVLLPWSAQDAGLAKIMFDTFVEVIRFLLDTLPASNNVLCFVWQFYVTHFTGSSIREHVLAVVHASLSTLPWERLWPRLIDLDAMMRLAEQYSPSCHAFLGGGVFVHVPWVKWAGHMQAEGRTLACLMHLTVRLSAEPAVKQSPHCVPLLNECRDQLPWHIIDPAAYDPVLNWFVMSCDPRVILPAVPEAHPVDVAVLDLLQEVAGFGGTTSRPLHMSTVRKRLALIRATSKLLVSCASRYKPVLVKNPSLFAAAVHRSLDLVDRAPPASQDLRQQIAETALLLGELLTLSTSSASLSPLLVSAVSDWLQGRTGSSMAVRGLLKALGVGVTDARALGILLEESLTAFFRDSQVPGISWLQAVSLIQAPVANAAKAGEVWEPLELVFVKEGHLLALHALLLHRRPADKGEQKIMLERLLEWLSAARVTETNEPKLMMLWKLAFSLSLVVCQAGVDDKLALDPSVVLIMNQLVAHLSNVGEEKGWGLLGVIGLRRQPQPSIRLRLAARSLAAFLLVQLPSAGEDDKRLVRLTADAPGALGDMSSSCTSDMLEAPAPSSCALQAVAALESMSTTKLSPELRATLDQTLGVIRAPTTSLASFPTLFSFLAQLYQAPFLTC